MARPRKSPASGAFPALTPAMTAWAESMGEAIGRGMARGFTQNTLLPNAAPAARRGRPPKAQAGGQELSASEKPCTEPGCNRPARSKGLCSAHYQAARRKSLAQQA